MSLATALLALLGISTASALGVGWVRAYALQQSILDVPNERSLHAVPVPRGGGVVISVAILAAAAVGLIVGLLPGNLAFALLGAVAAISAIGWLDDRRSASRSVRLLVQVAASLWAVLWLQGVPELHLPSGDTWRLGDWGILLAVLALVWLTNLYNFMDGIDGIAGLTAVLAGGFTTAYLAGEGAAGLSLVGLAVTGAAIGFLKWNWPPAQIFMGDVGSGVLGFTFCFLAFAADRSGNGSFLVLLLPLGVFVSDATFTLFRRLARGERIYIAHRTHVYQRLVQNGWSHRTVTLVAAGVTLVLCAVAAGVAWRPDAYPASILAFVLVPAVAGWTALAISSRVREAETENRIGGSVAATRESRR